MIATCSYQRGVLRVCDDLYDFKSYSRVVAISFGKAAHRMAEILARQVGATVEGIIVDPNPHPYQLAGYRYFAGGHPQPNEESVRGAEAILKTLGALNAQSLAIFLVSGGGSAAVEKPADAEITLPDLVATYKALVNSGAPIAQINAVRKHLSAVKGGRMAQAANGAQQVSIMVSDVPENALDSLSSGPTMPDSSTVEDCYRIVHEHNMLPDFPALCASCLSGARWMKRRSRMMQRLSAHDGGRCCRMRQRKKPRPQRREAGLRRGDRPQL